MDATYNTNNNRLPFVNVVGVLNTGFPSLKTFFIAGGWIIDESSQSYNWFIQKLRDTVWPLDNHNYTKIIVRRRVTSRGKKLTSERSWR
jgi:hypothetical protein